MILKYTKNLAPYILITVVAVYMFRGIFAPGPMSGYDNSVHYAEAHYLARTLIPTYHWISGWTMKAMAGCPILIHHPQTGFLLIALLNKVFFLPLSVSYKIVVLFTYAFLGASFFKIASYRFGKIPALFTALCLMLQKDVYCGRILEGIWNNFLGMSLFLIFFHMLDKYVTGLTFRRAIALGLILAFTVPTHIFAAAFSVLIFMIYALPYISGRPPGGNLENDVMIYLVVPVSALAISLYYIKPFISAPNYFQAVNPKDMYSGLVWSLKSFFGPLEHGGGARQFVINLPVFARIVFSAFGVCVFFASEKRPQMRRFLNCTIAFTVIALVIFSDTLPNIFGAWQKLPLIRSLQTNRFLIYAQTGQYLFAAYGISRILERIGPMAITGPLLCIALLPAIFLHYTDFARPASRTLDQSKSMPYVRDVWRWVDKNMSSAGSRIVYQNTVGNIDDPILNRSDVFALSGVFTDVGQIGVFLTATGFPQERYVRNDHGSIFGEPVSSISADYIKEMMDYFNASHIVTVEPILERKLNDSSLFFKEENYGPFSIMRSASFDGGWIKFEKAAECGKARISDQRATFDISGNSGANTAYVKISYHPLWRGYLNGENATINMDSYGLMKIPLYKKDDLRLELSFRPVDHYSLVVSLAGLILLTLIVAIRKR